MDESSTVSETGSARYLWNLKEWEKKKKKEKKTSSMGENICKQCHGQGLNQENIQTSHTTQQQKNKPPN